MLDCTPLDPDDASLVARCRAGDATAWRTLVERYQRLVYTIVRRAGLDDHAAADVFQTVFARLLEGLAGLREPQRLQAWIVTTAKREAVLQRGRAARAVSMTAHDDEGDAAPEWEVAADAALPEDALAEIELLDRVRRGIERLDPRCRDLITLLFRHDGEPPAYDEVARRLGLPVGGVGPNRARCLARLRALVA
jgi:RNA polymerase sigma factor (sigma-70 family)